MQNSMGIMASKKKWDQEIELIIEKVQPDYFLMFHGKPDGKNFYFNTKNNSIEGEFEKKRKESNLILADDVIRDINGNPIGKKEKVVPFKIDINPKW